MKAVKTGFLFLIAVLLFFLTGCQQLKNNESTISVYADSRLSPAFKELADELYQADKIKVNLKFDESRSLCQFINKGSKADLIAFADKSNVKNLMNAKIIDNYKSFASDYLVAAKLKNSSVSVSSLSDFEAPGIKLVVGNTSPESEYTHLLFDFSLYKENHKYNILSVDLDPDNGLNNILDALQNGGGNVGIVYLSSLASSNTAEPMHIKEFDQAKILYSMAKLKSSNHYRESQEFAGLILSEKGKKCLQKYGFSNA